MKILEILENENWMENYDFFNEFKNSSYYDVLLDTYENLNTDILFDSHVHGQDHIERVIFYALVLAWKYDLDEKDTDILRYAASLHDTQRVSDGYDTEHGHRAAQESAKYAHKLDGEDLEILKGVMACHARNDKLMEESIREFDVKDMDRALKLAKLFKDSDGLDRVRLGDLKTKFLRNKFTHDLVDFAQDLYDAYQ
jgi:hypothetical protein